MTAEDATAGAGGRLPSSGDIRALSAEIEAVHGSLKRSWRWIGLLALAAIGLGIWCTIQQITLNSKEAQIARLEQRTTLLVEQNTDRNALQDQNAHHLCVRLNDSRKVIVGVWGKVQFMPGVDRAAEVAMVKAAEPLGKCP